MYQIKKNSIKWLKSIHLVAISGWLGGVLVMAFFAIWDQRIPIEQLGGLYWLAEAIDMKIVVPCAMLTLLTGIAYGLLTPWGFFRQKWLIVKWILTVAVILSGSIFTNSYLHELSDLVMVYGHDVLANAQYNQIAMLNTMLSCVQAAMLISAVVLSIWKPWRSTQKTKQLAD